MKLAILSGVLILLGISGILISTIVRIHEPYHDTSLDYGVFMDAGSTATKAYIYQWEHKTTTKLPIVKVSRSEKNELKTFTVLPGIASISPNYSQVGDYLDPVINWAKAFVPKHRISSTPIFVKGTGGLRQLSNESASALMTNVIVKLHDCGFYFDPTFATIISGTDEAGYGFLAVNSLLNTLPHPSTKTPTVAPYGSLDMGGISSEIAFISEHPPPAQYTFIANFNGSAYTIYAQSNDGLGINQARYAFNKTLLAGSIPPSGNTILDPCIPVGYYENVTLTFNNNKYWYIFTGAVNNGTNTCGILVDKFVSQMTSSLPAPPIRGNFVVADHYIDVKNFFKLKHNANMLELQAKVGSFCALTYGDAMGYNDKYTNEVQYYCFMGNYFISLVTNYYGFNPTQRQLIWEETVRDTPVTWALGSMQSYIEALEPDTSSRTREHIVRFFQTPGGIVLLFVSCLLFALGVVLFILQRRRATHYVTVR